MALSRKTDHNIEIKCPCCEESVFIDKLRGECSECGADICILQNAGEASEHEQMGWEVVVHGKFWVAASCPEKHQGGGQNISTD